MIASTDVDRQRLQVDRVGNLGVGHDRCRIRVDEHDAVAFFAQRPARLNAGVVELGGLADDDRPRADHHDLSRRERAQCALHAHAVMRQPAAVLPRTSVHTAPVSFTGFPWLLYAYDAGTTT